VLPVEIVRKIFRKNPNLVVRFLKLLKPVPKNATERIPFTAECTPFAIGIDRYKSFLPKLIKKRVEKFVKLYETHLPNIVLNNTCAELFLKKAKQHLIKKPLTYICLLLKAINEHLMESIFSSMLPEEISSFSTDKMLNYLKHYPRDKKYELLRKSYKNKYNADLLDEKCDPEFVTSVTCRGSNKLELKSKRRKRLVNIPGITKQLGFVIYLLTKQYQLSRKNK